MIAEGDILPLCVRLFSELLQGRVNLEFPESSSILSRRAKDLLSRHSSRLHALKGGHRSEEFNTQLLPHAESTITSIGQALAYDAAKSRGVSPKLLDLYLVSAARSDPRWFMEHGGSGWKTSDDISSFESRSITQAMPDLDVFLDLLKVDKYVRAPIVQKQDWSNYYPLLQKYTADESLPIRAKL